MNGTEKQISWAEQIKESAIRKNEKSMSEAQKRYAHEGAAGKKLYDLRVMTYNVIREGFENLVNASDVIDNRDNLTLAVAKMNASKFDKKMLQSVFDKPSDFFQWI